MPDYALTDNDVAAIIAYLPVGSALRIQFQNAARLEPRLREIGEMVDGRGPDTDWSGITAALDAVEEDVYTMTRVLLPQYLHLRSVVDFLRP